MSEKNEPPDWDVVDQGSDMSFPASDPPAWMGSSAHAAPSDATLLPDQPTRAARQWLIPAALVVIAMAVGILWTRASRPG